MEHPIENIIKSSMDKIRDMVDVNTVVGSPVMLGDGTMILPVSKVTLGFITGGGEYMQQKNVKTNDQQEGQNRFPFAGSVATAMVITPMAFLSVSGGNVNVLTAKYDCTLDRLIQAVPDAISKLTEKLVCNCGCGKEDGDED